MAKLKQKVITKVECVKRCFKCHKDAKKFANWSFRAFGKKMVVYYCNTHKCFHLTKKVKNNH